MAALVREYYLLLRSVLRTQPHLRACLKRCRHCCIFFLTHPRNAGRQDLRCPFGCRQAHRQQQSTRRSVAYYQDPEGKKKKCALNQRRVAPAAGDHPPRHPPQLWVSPAQGVVGNRPLVEYVRLGVSLIEGRAVSREEVLAMLAKVLRQPRIGRRRKFDYFVRRLNENPP